MAKDQDYEAAVVKGTKLLRLIQAIDTKATIQSKFKDEKELEKNGYTKHEDGTFGIACIRDVLRELGANDKMEEDGGDNVRTYHIHDCDSVIDGVVCPATQAYFTQLSNPTSGILIADTNLSPIHAGPFSDPPTNTSPALHHWSDIAFLQYLSTFASPPPSPLPLNYIFRITIQNIETYTLLQKVIEKHGHDTYFEWPGVSFEAESEEGKAILGTPSGSGVAWMLVQRKKELGERNVERVTVFNAKKEGDLYRWPSLLFWIG